MLLAVLLLGCAPCPDPEPVPPHSPYLCDGVFDPFRVLDVRIELAPAVWAALQQDYTRWEERLEAGVDVKPYHPVASFELDGERFEGAAIRLKGNPCCSWRGDKLQFVIAFDEYDEDARFRGLRKLALDAPPYDPSVLRERIALSYFRDAGLPASCANSAALSINGVYYGLYTNIEYVDREFLEREFPDDEAGGFGDLYKWDYNGRRYRKRNNRGVDTRDQLEAFRAIDDLETFEELVNVDQALDFWAAEAVINQSDGYWAGSINFYLYHHPERGWEFLPWDLDHAITWWGARRDPFRHKDFHGISPLIELAWSTPEGRVRFAEAVARMHRRHDLDRLLQRVDDWSAQIRPYVDREPHKAFTLDQHDAEVQKIRERLSIRHGFLCGRRSGAYASSDDGEAPPTPLYR